MEKNISGAVLVSFAFFFISFLVLLFFSSTDVQAIPAFARKYETSCSTCHYAFPKLNAFGRAFRNNGYRYPAEEESMRKEEPVSLGSEAYKKVFPKSIWPSDMARYNPLSLHMVQRVNVTPDATPSWEFEFPHEIELLASGTLGETFSYFGEIEIEQEDELEFSFHLQYDPRVFFHIKMGTIDPRHVQTQFRLTAAQYNYSNFRVVRGGGDLEPSAWRYRDSLAGTEIWGAINGPNKKGGLTYAVGIGNGQGISDNNDDKDLYARVSYKFGGLGEAGGAGAGGEGDYWKDDSFRIGLFTYSGNHSYVNEALDMEFDDDVSLGGAEFDWWFKSLNLFGAYLSQKDDNPAGDNVEVDSKAWFTEANYVFYPWLIGLFRYELTDVETDPEPIKQIVPAVVLLPRANIKFVLEAQLRLDDAGENKDKYVLGIAWSF